MVTAQQGLYDVYRLSRFLLSSHRKMLPWSIHSVTDLVTQSSLATCGFRHFRFRFAPGVYNLVSILT